MFDWIGIIFAEFVEEIMILVAFDAEGVVVLAVG